MRSPCDAESVEIDIGTRCHLRCSNCTQLVAHQPRREDIPLERFEHAVRSMAGWRGHTIRITGGEPTLHAQFEPLRAGLRNCGAEDWRSMAGSILGISTASRPNVKRTVRPAAALRQAWDRASPAITRRSWKCTAIGRPILMNSVAAIRRCCSPGRITKRQPAPRRSNGRPIAMLARYRPLRPAASTTRAPIFAVSPHRSTASISTAGMPGRSNRAGGNARRRISRTS